MVSTFAPEHRKMERLKCPAIGCNSTFSRQFNLNRHYERFHVNNDTVEKCLLCGQIYNSCEELQIHYKRIHKPSKKFVLKESAFKKSVVSYRYTFPTESLDFIQSQQKVLPTLVRMLEHEAAQKTLIKAGLIFICQMSMLDHTGEKLTSALIPFRSPSFLVSGYSKHGIKQNVKKSFMLQEREMEEFCNCGSNWTFDRAVSYDLEISAMRPILVGDGDFYTSNDMLNVRNISNNRFLFNPNNRDDKCFLYCVLEHLKTTSKNPLFSTITFKQFEKKLNLDNISFPISLQHVTKFCKQNPNLKLKINVLLRNTKNHIFPLEYGLGEKNSSRNLNLLLVQRKIKEKDEVKNHFLLIKNIHKFLRSCYSNGTYKKTFSCVNCFNTFSAQNVLDKHEAICCLNKPRIEKCSENPHLEFKNFQNKHPIEYIAFLDFECVLPKVTEKCLECTHLRCKCDKSYTQVTAEQHPITYSLLILDQNSQIIHQKTHTGNDAASHLIDHLLEQEEHWISNLFTSYKELDMSEKDWRKYEQSQNCYLCEKPITTVKCRDHSHFTGKFLGAACQQCNLARRRPRKLNIFLHNGSKYDFHFIIKALNNKKKVKNIRILPYNGENFRTISFNSFQFVDSMSFLQSSLAKLSEDLSKTDNPYSILKQTSLVKNNRSFDERRYRLVLGKSFFPYEYW